MGGMLRCTQVYALVYPSVLFSTVLKVHIQEASMELNRSWMDDRGRHPERLHSIIILTSIHSTTYNTLTMQAVKRVSKKTQSLTQRLTRLREGPASIALPARVKEVEMSFAMRNRDYGARWGYYSYLTLISVNIANCMTEWR